MIYRCGVQFSSDDTYIDKDKSSDGYIGTFLVHKFLDYF